jgi:hypothetical protein
MAMIRIFIILVSLAILIAVGCSNRRSPTETTTTTPPEAKYHPESAYDSFIVANEGEVIIFTEKQPPWSYGYGTWVYITTESNPPTPQFFGVPPGVDNLGLPPGATMPTAFGYTGDTAITTFFWVPSHCQSIPMLFTYFNTSNSTYTPYNYHFFVLFWRSDLDWWGVPLDSKLVKIRVNDVNVAPYFEGLPNEAVAVLKSTPPDTFTLGFSAWDSDCDCNPPEDSIQSVTATENGVPIGVLSKPYVDWQFSWNITSADLGLHHVQFRVADSRGMETIKDVIINVIPQVIIAEPKGVIRL